MSGKLNLRDLFSPWQPGPQATECVSNSIAWPCHDLQSYIWCYWEVRSLKPLNEELACTILSDGCIDIFLDLSKNDDSFVMGYTNRWRSYVLGKSFRYLGIRFLPGMFPFIFNISALELTNAIEKLKLVDSRTAHFLTEKCGSANHLDEIKKNLDKFFLGKISAIHKRFDQRVNETLTKIYKNYNGLSVENDINGIVNVSPRHLRRLFSFFVGDNIGSFAKVIRFQNYLKAEYQQSRTQNEKLYFDFGYYDQAHLIRDFKTFSGYTPRRFFKGCGNERILKVTE